MRCLLRIASALTILGACGADEQPANTAVTSGIAADKQLLALSAAEQQQLCAAMEQAVLDFYRQPNTQDAACLAGAKLATAVAAGTDPAAECEQIYGQCMQSSQEPVIETRCTPQGFAGCDLTVGDAETCLQETLELVPTIFSMLSGGSCENAGSGPLLVTGSMLQAPPTCDALSMRCPGVTVPDAQTADL